MRKGRISFSLFLVVFLSLFLAGCASTAIPNPKGYVNDFAGMLSEKEQKALEATLVQYQKQTSNEITVVTVTSLGGKSIEDYTMALAEKWQVGKKGKDNGVIILIAKDEKKIRIEVGYGLEPVLTDAQSKQIIDREMTPRFKKDDFAGGITAAVKAVMAVIAGTYVSSGSVPEESGGGWPLWLIIAVVIGGIFLLIFIISIAADAGGGGSWSSGGGSGGGGGGGGGFGGGGFGGGGASGGW